MQKQFSFRYEHNSVTDQSSHYKLFKVKIFSRSLSPAFSNLFLKPSLALKSRVRPRALGM